VNVAENRRTRGFRIEASGRASSIDVFPSFAKKEEEKIRVFGWIVLYVVGKGRFVLLERTRSSRQQERRSACASLRAWKCVL
jgi:hypothetical protein